MLNNDSVLPAEGLLRIRQVLKIIPVSRSTWWAGVAAGKFPKPVYLPGRITAWRIDEIRALIDGLPRRHGSR